PYYFQHIFLLKFAMHAFLFSSRTSELTPKLPVQLINFILILIHTRFFLKAPLIFPLEFVF
ncbi:MAG: hypothetical protein AAFX80_10755, partial [Cyanobacteria bacterium J06639_18]